MRSATFDRPDRVIRSRRILTEGAFVDGALIIRDGRISEIATAKKIEGDGEIIDVGESVVMPGLVDTHVHINEPGRADWEGFESATRAAAAGGITTLVDMPLNCSPVTTNTDALSRKIQAAEGKLWVDCGFFGGIVGGRTNEVEELADAGVLGFKVFLIDSGLDDFTPVREADLREAMPIVAEAGLPLLVHAELADSSVHSINRPTSYPDYLQSRPSRWETDAIGLMLSMGLEYGCHVHVVHVSSASSIPLLRDARHRGQAVSAETCPHYLFFSADDIRDGDTRFKCAPPIRESANRDRLWEGLKWGGIDMIVSDHSPAPPAFKLHGTGDFTRAWGGISSLQLGLPIIWTAARSRGVTIGEISEWMSRRPAELVGLNDAKGSLEPGSDADLVIWNPDEIFEVDGSKLFHRHAETPYDGLELYGVVQMTFLRGQPIFDGGRFGSPPRGRVLLRPPYEQAA